MSTRGRLLPVDAQSALVTLSAAAVASILIGVSVVFMVVSTAGVSPFQALSVGFSGLVVLVGVAIDQMRG